MSEGDRAYNAAVISDLHKELISHTERERLAKLPWATSLIEDLLRRIANLRAELVQASTAYTEAKRWHAGREEALTLQLAQARAEAEKHCLFCALGRVPEYQLCRQHKLELATALEPDDAS